MGKDSISGKPFSDILGPTSSLDRDAIEGLLTVETQGVGGFLKKQVEKFLIRAPQSLEQFYREMNAGDFSAARETIHKLAGYAGMLGAKSIRVRSLEIETALEAGNSGLANDLKAALPVIWAATLLDYNALIQRVEDVHPPE